MAELTALAGTEPHRYRHRHRHAGAFPTPAAARRYWLILICLAIAAPALLFANLAWDNPMPLGSRGFWRIAELRATNMVIVVVVAFCQGIATVAFHTITNNRIITPAIMGFESLYRVVQTGAVFLFGVAGATMVQGVWQYLGQVGLMVGFAALLYGWLLTGRRAGIHLTLLVGIILGTGLGALATFMQRLLTPGEFDVLTARLIGSIANADATYLPAAMVLAGLAGGYLWLRARTLNVIALGRDVATNLGINHKRESIVMLMLIAVLMAVTTSLVGPLAFLGFLVAMIAYQLADTFDHRYLFPTVWLTGIVLLAGAYFVLRHLFYAEGSVGIIIEIVGGTFFIVHLLRKGRL
ncbi:iron chelate uptake ABC transporter family permease subunit [Enemella sp. A6]|uniref:iron chelate uptake ABC transporter family permease subunit n=1 Tax=Enemella sp. A6 TaxID=3440152 RepID=UPI003EC11BCA